MQQTQLPPEAKSIKDLNKIAGFIALIFGIILLIIGIIFLFIIIGFIPIIFAIINFIIRDRLKQINRIIDKGKYKKAKEKQLIWGIIGFLLAGIIVGIILLIAYIKYDKLIRHATT